MITSMARFGENLRTIREAVLRLDQKQLAQYLLKKKGGPMGQASLSKLEALEFAPKPDTVMRIAEGLAPLLGQPAPLVFQRLLEGVSSRYDAVQARRASPAPDATDHIISDFADSLPIEKRAAFHDAMKAYAAEQVKKLVRQRPVEKARPPRRVTE